MRCAHRKLFWPSYMINNVSNMSDGKTVGFDTLGIIYITVEITTDLI